MLWETLSPAEQVLHGCFHYLACKLLCVPECNTPKKEHVFPPAFFCALQFKNTSWPGKHKHNVYVVKHCGEHRSQTEAAVAGKAHIPPAVSLFFFFFFCCKLNEPHCRPLTDADQLSLSHPPCSWLAGHCGFSLYKHESARITMNSQDNALLSSPFTVKGTTDEQTQRRCYRNN